MKLFDYFNAHKAKAFGVVMAQIYMEQLDTKKKLDEKKINALSLKAIEKIERQIKDFKKVNKLNFYKIAQTGNAFKWELRDAGFEAAYVDKLTEWFVIKLKS